MHGELTTERMVLRRFTVDDVGELVALDGDPEVMRYLTGGRATPREVIVSRVLPGFMRSYAQGAGFGVWAAVETASGRFLGWFSLRAAGAEDAAGAGSAGGATEATLGYRLRRDAWGQGFATEGARALLRRAFAELGVSRVTASTYEENRASRRVMERVGMTFGRAFRLSGDDLAAQQTLDGTALEVWEGDEVEYALTREQWVRQGA